MSSGKVPEPALTRRLPDQERVLWVDSDLFLHHLPHGSAQSLSDAKLPLLQNVFEDLVLLLFQGSLDYLRHRWNSFKGVLHESAWRMVPWSLRKLRLPRRPVQGVGNIELDGVKPDRVGSHDYLWNGSDAQGYEEGCESKPVLLKILP